MTTYTVEAQYHTGAHAKVDLKEGRTWGDVHDWYVKWDTLHVRFKGGAENWVEFDLNSDSTDGTDWKRPLNVTVYSRDAKGETDFDSVVAELT